MTTLDIFFVTVLGIGFVVGIIKGAIKQIASLAAIVLGIYGAYLFYKPLASLLAAIHFSPHVAVVASFLLLFIAIALAIHLLGRLLTFISKAAMLSWLNRLAGGFIAMLAFALLLGVMINLYEYANKEIGRETEHGNSFLYSPLKALPEALLPLIRFDSLKSSLTNTIDKI